MKQILVATIICIIIMFTVSHAYSEELEYPLYGISASFNGSLLLSVPIWLDQSITISPGTSLRHLDRSHQEITIELALKYNFREYPAFPFLGVFSQANNYRYFNNERAWGYTVGILSGGEYFLNKHFSLMAQFSIASNYIPKMEYYSDILSKTRVETYSQILGSFYF